MKKPSKKPSKKSPSKKPAKNVSYTVTAGDIDRPWVLTRREDANSSKKPSKKPAKNASYKQRIEKATRESKKSHRLAAEIALKRAEIVEARRRVAADLARLDEALRALDARLPPMVWKSAEGMKASFSKGSIAGAIIEILSVRPSTRGEIRGELRVRFPDSPIKDKTLDTILVRLKAQEFILQDEPRAPYRLAPTKGSSR